MPLREHVQEIYAIVPFENVRSVLERGWLCNIKARTIQHRSIALESVQDIRATKRVPGGRLLHEYANLYLNARNAMMYERLGFPQVPPPHHVELSVVRFNTSILKGASVIVSDANAAKHFAGFYEAEEALNSIDPSKIFRRYWDNDVQKAEMMAEVLVPTEVAPKHILGIDVCCESAAKNFTELSVSVPPRINRNVFFNDGGRYHA
jgi:hypothetical protein